MYYDTNIELYFYIFIGLVLLTFIIFGVWIASLSNRIRAIEERCDENFKQIANDIKTLFGCTDNSLERFSRLDSYDLKLKIDLDKLKEEIYKINQKIYPPLTTFITGSLQSVPTTTQKNQYLSAGVPVRELDINFVPGSVPRENLNPTTKEPANYIPPQPIYKLAFKTIEVHEPFNTKIAAIDIIDTREDGKVVTRAFHEALIYIVANQLYLDMASFHNVINEFQAWMKKPIE